MTTDILSKIRRDMTQSPVACVKKNWIATAAMLAASAAASIFGGAKAKKAADKAKSEQRYRNAANDAWYQREYNTDYLDTKAGSNLMRRAQEVQDKYIKRADGAAAVGGGTAAATAQAKEAANRTIGDATASIAANNTSRKQRVADAHLNNEMQSSREREQSEINRANAITSAAQSFSNTAASAAVTRKGSLANKGNTLSNNGLSSSNNMTDNPMITSVSDGLSPTALSNDGLSLLDSAVGDLMRRKPNIHV